MSSNEDRLSAEPFGAQHASDRPEGVNKRRRVALACSICRARKSRCDGKRPECTSCMQLGFECHYQQSSTYSNTIVGKEYLSSIQDRLELVEARLANLELSHEPSRSRNTYATSTDPGPQSVEASITETPNVDMLPNVDTTAAPDATDGMGAITFSEDEAGAFLGPSSNIALIRHISRAVAHQCHSSRPWKPSPVEVGSFEAGEHNVAGTAGTASTIDTPANASDAREKLNICVLPPEAICRELISWYFGYTGSIFPFIHQASFMVEFEQARERKFRRIRPTWLALLNMIFAHAVIHAEQTLASSRPTRTVITNPKAEADLYYRRASGLYSERRVDMVGTSVEDVQCLLLMCLHLLSTRSSTQVWNTSGLAVRGAFQLGLHSVDLGKTFSPVEQEIRKRVWHMCIINERLLSMTHGRPASIPDDYVRLELPMAYPTSVEQPVEVTYRERLSTLFFRNTIELYKIMDMVITLLYNKNLASSFDAEIIDMIPHIYKIENLLSHWLRNLEPEIRPIHEDEITAGVAQPQDSFGENYWINLRLRFILTLRCSNVQILLHRPVLMKLLHGRREAVEGMNMSTLQGIGSQSVQSAIPLTKKVISLVRAALGCTNGRSTYGLVGSWWNTLYYTFNAALVLGACILIELDQRDSGGHIGAMHPPQSIEELTTYLNMAVEVIHRLQGSSNHHVVEPCRNYLDQFVQVVKILGSGTGAMEQAPDSVSALNQMGNPHGCENLEHMADSMLDGAFTTQQSPLGMGTGQFILYDDLELMNNYVLQ